MHRYNFYHIMIDRELYRANRRPVLHRGYIFIGQIRNSCIIMSFPYFHDPLSQSQSAVASAPHSTANIYVYSKMIYVYRK